MHGSILLVCVNIFSRSYTDRFNQPLSLTTKEGILKAFGLHHPSPSVRLRVGHAKTFLPALATGKGERGMTKRERIEEGMTKR